MKKVGIVTFHTSNNYGALLQTYALQQSCKKNGYDVEIVNYDNKYVTNYSPKQEIIASIKNRDIKKIIKHLMFYSYNKSKYNKMNLFRKKYLKISPLRFVSEDELEKRCKQYDILIVGSDQVWNTKIYNGYNKVYFFEGINNTKKISYAASLSGCKYNPREKKIIGDQLNNFSHISIREKSDIKTIEEITKKDVSVDLDPTLLLEEKEWKEIFDINPIIKKKYILVYTVEENDEIKTNVDIISRIYNLKVVYFTKFSKYENKFKSVFNSGINEFLNYFYNAEFIVTNSFHGTVFSILFHKKFFVINHKSRGNRIVDLLKNCGLENQIINSNVTKEECEEIINYDIVDKKLNRLREMSKNNLIKYLKD